MTDGTQKGLLGLALGAGAVLGLRALVRQARAYDFRGKVVLITGGSRGLGLGLFIVREIVRAHGGVVEVSSSEADGTRFSLRLPRRVARRTPKSAPRGAACAGHGAACAEGRYERG